MVMIPLAGDSQEQAVGAVKFSDAVQYRLVSLVPVTLHSILCLTKNRNCTWGWDLHLVTHPDNPAWLAENRCRSLGRKCSSSHLYHGCWVMYHRQTGASALYHKFVTRRACFVITVNGNSTYVCVRSDFDLRTYKTENYSHRCEKFDNGLVCRVCLKRWLHCHLWCSKLKPRWCL